MRATGWNWIKCNNSSRNREDRDGDGKPSPVLFWVRDRSNYGTLGSTSNDFPTPKTLAVNPACAFLRKLRR